MEIIENHEQHLKINENQWIPPRAPFELHRVPDPLELFARGWRNTPVRLRGRLPTAARGCWHVAAYSCDIYIYIYI